MTSGQKATKVLDYLEGLDSKTIINILNPHLDDNVLALLFDKLVEDGVIEREDDDEDDVPEWLAKYSDCYREGILYAMEQLDEDDKAIIRAECNKAYKMHLVPNSVTVDDHKITDLLEEYGDDNDLPEGWYLDEYDASEVLSMV